ncbi:MAG: FAD binding domain-containing protein [Hyphomicrobiales bacterium]|nr:FAD binding domain-containing protein [Hyphomicrobiales bacterium]
MKSPSFDYVAATTVAEATAALASEGISTAAIAGGQSLLPMLSLRVAQPDIVVDLGALQELREISISSGSIGIGALTTHAAIEDGLLAEPFDGLMQKVASKISYRAVRHHGTIGGSVALADPAADWPGCLMALGAAVRISGVTGQRSEPLRSFIQGQYQTSLTPDEIIVGFDVPRPAAPLRWGVFKVARKSGAFANSIAFAVSQGRDGPVSVVLAAAAPRPLLLPKVAEELGARRTSDEVLRAAIAEDIAAIVPQDDAYLVRLHTSTVLRAVQEMQSK